MLPRVLHVVLHAVLLAGFARTTDALQEARSTRPHPNVLLIVLDDFGTDKVDFYGETPPTCPSGCEGAPASSPPPSNCVSPYPAMPNLDALRRDGIWFSHAYVTPVCSSTRAWIQTGRYGFRTGIGRATSTVQVPGDFGLPSSEKLLAELLHEGFPSDPRPALGLPYACAAFGKWHLSTGRAQEYGHPIENGYDHFAGSPGNVGNFYRYDKVVQDVGSAPVVVKIDGRHTVPPFGTDTWHASVTSRDALAWIGAQTHSFLAYVAFNPPHTPMQVPPLTLLPPETRCELVRAGLAAGDILAPASDPPALLKLVYRAMVEAVDTEMGNLIHGLAPETRANTMIFVVGDNGSPDFVIDDPPHDDEAAKGQVKELGIRVPLVVSGPLVPGPIPSEGWCSDALVSGVDFWLTIAEITGADAAQVVPLAQLDSVSFLPVIRAPTSAGARTRVFSQIFSPNGVLQVPPPSCYTLNRRSLSDGEYKYLRTQQALATSPCGAPQYVEELYHLALDPEEHAELISAGSLAPQAAAHLQTLRAEMDALSGT